MYRLLPQGGLLLAYHVALSRPTDSTGLVCHVTIQHVVYGQCYEDSVLSVSGKTIL